MSSLKIRRRRNQSLPRAPSLETCRRTSEARDRSNMRRNGRALFVNVTEREIIELKVPAKEACFVIPWLYQHNNV